GILRSAIGAFDVIVCTGGLGPTEDDVTREALAAVLDIPLELDEAIAEHIRQRLERRGLVAPAINRPQALGPRGATGPPDANGTAPGLWIEHGGSAFVLLPGPPREMTPMFDAVLEERLRPRAGGAGLFRRVLRIVGRTESDVDSVAQPVYSQWLGQSIP